MLNTFVCAKLNLALDVVGITENGYHNLDMVFCSVNEEDRIKISASNQNCVYMNDVLQDNRNIVNKTINLLYAHYDLPKLRVDICKSIPMCAGMGGSSADASAVLKSFCQLFSIEDSALIKIGNKLGSDVAYMYYGGMKRAQGKGEILSNLDFIPFYALVCQSTEKAETKDVFKLYDKNPIKTIYTQELINNLSHIEKYTNNALQYSAVSIAPSIKNTLEELKKYNNYSCMTGSGSAVYTTSNDLDKLKFVKNKIESKYQYCKILETQEKGIRFE